MKRSHHLCVSLIFGLLLGSAAVGCGVGGKNTFDPTAKDKLEEIGQMLKTAQATNMKLPARLAELDSVEPLAPMAAQEIRSGEIVYIWGAGLSTSPNASSSVIAHEKKVPSEGGWALMQNGTVKRMTADEFRSAPKASR
jgi:hypothetical protein